MVAMATVKSWISQEPFDIFDYLFHQPQSSSRAYKLENLSKIRNFDFAADARCLQSASFRRLVHHVIV